MTDKADKLNKLQAIVDELRYKNQASRRTIRRQFEQIQKYRSLSSQSLKLKKRVLELEKDMREADKMSDKYRQTISDIQFKYIRIKEVAIKRVVDEYNESNA